jgi:DNA-directed RNA polymerase subunit RPC12/RpoP
MELPDEQEFHEFIGEALQVAVVELAAAFPDQRHLEISWHTIETYNSEWSRTLRSNPDAFLRAFEQALTTYPAIPPYGQVSFYDGTTNRADPPFIRLTDVPFETPIAEAPNRVGELVRVIGYVESLDDPEVRVAKAVYECSHCEHTHRMTVIGPESVSLSACPECGFKDGYQFDGLRSQMMDAQKGRIHPLDVTEDTTVDIELQHSLIDSVSLYEPVALTGQMYVEGETHQRSQLCLLVNNIESTDRTVHRPNVEAAETYLSAHVAEPEHFTADLREWMLRSTTVLSTQSLTEEEAQAKIITPLLHKLGWNVYSNNVRIEYSEPGGGGTVDYMLTDGSNRPLIPIEAKAPNIDLGSAVDQLERYMQRFSCEIGLLANGREYRLYDLPPDTQEIRHRWTLDVRELPVNTAALTGLRYDVAVAEDSLRAIYAAH